MENIELIKKIIEEVIKGCDSQMDYACANIILQLIQDGIDISVLNLKENRYNSAQLYLICSYLKEGVDITPYVTPKFGCRAMEEIKAGLISGVDVSIYADPCFHYDQMEEIRLGLEEGIDVTSYANPKFNACVMEFIHDAITEGLDVIPFITGKETADQLWEIKEGLLSGIDISVYADPKAYDNRQMCEIREGLEAGLDVSSYADPNMDWGEMRKIRRELLKSLRAK